MNSNITKYRFAVYASGGLNSFAHLRLFNGFDDAIAQGYGRLETEIPKGLYRLRMEFNEQVIEKDYRVDKDITDNITIPGSYSSIPNKQLDSSHEYYSETSQEWSKKSTITGLTLIGKSSLFLFFRYSNVEARSSSQSKDRSLSENFHLLDKKRNKLYSLSKDNVKEDLQMGWMAFHEPLQSGVYFLVFTGEQSREIPLYVYDNWQTQVFITFANGPIFSTARILLGEVGVGFDMYDPISIQIDAILQKMYNGIFFVPPDLIEMTAVGKWENPMLAIIVSYAYLLSDEKKHDDLFKIILQNLQNRILHNTDSPDIIALQILAAEHERKTIDTVSIEFPCMVLAGMKAFMRYSIDHPQCIKQDSIAEKAISKIKLDCVWTSYEPLDSVQPEMKLVKKIHPSAPLDLDPMDTPYKEIKSTVDIGQPGLEKQDWITLSIFNQLACNDPSDPDMSTPSIQDIASQFRLTPKIVKDHLNRIPTHDSALMNFTNNYFKGTPIAKTKVMNNIKTNISILLQK